jgi:hypothetical protein
MKQGSILVSDVLQGGTDTNVLLQLPHFDYDVLKKLGRKKVRSLAELSTMDAEERLELFVTSGVRLLSLPDLPAYFAWLFLTVYMGVNLNNCSPCMVLAEINNCSSYSIILLTCGLASTIF